MKKITFLFAVLWSFGLVAQQNSADTIFVNTPLIELDWYGGFDSILEFPDEEQSFRQIVMTVKLGQYNCPPTDEFCHQWDYTTSIQLLKEKNNGATTFEDGDDDDDDENYDIYELGRFITPFATSGWSRFGSNWKQPYYFDVTDFYPLLKGENKIRIFYEGYSGGFTAEIEFAFIEGVPEREVLDIKNVYQLSKTYGDAQDAFNNYLEVFTDTPPAGMQDALLKVLVTGHGSDLTEQCCEFSSHYYDVFLNEDAIDRIDIWRDDCGENDLYPQGGTWIYDRSNWCPGAKVEPIYHNLNLQAETEYDLQVQFEEYVGSGNLGNYNYNATLFYYGETNKTLDAAVLDIITPTTDPNHFRSNPSGDSPIIKVRNTGSSTINSIDFEYGVVGFGSATHNWSGNLEPQEEKEIKLTALEALKDISLNEESGNLMFEVEIISVNGQEDEDENNNYLSSNFSPAPLWPSQIILKLKTGSKIANGFLSNFGASDISWEIKDMQDNIVESRTNTMVNSEYFDTIALPETGFYKLKIKNENCFGLNWWPFMGVQNYNQGFFRVTKLNGSNLPMKNYTYTGTAHDDWGCSYTQYFSTDVDLQNVDIIAKAQIKLYPNPAKDFLYIDLGKGLSAPFKVRLVDIQGRNVYENKLTENQVEIPVQNLNNGLYILIFEDNNQNKFIEKVVIGE